MTREDIAQNVRTLFDKYVSVLGEMSEILDEVSDEEIIVFGSTIKAIEAESCEDCISRSYVINELIKHQHSTEFCTEHHIDHSIDLGMATIVVNNAPSVTPARKKGEWEVAIGYDPNRSFMCDCCMKMAYEPTPYCPNCGAEMNEEDADGN